jgi:VIT1/CCC1 family predicted Fe2+/Mn2+ transporter
MPQTPHIEKHFTSGLVVRDAVIGMADGLTVPFALAAGLSGAVVSTAIIVTAGSAEIVAGSDRDGSADISQAARTPSTTTKNTNEIYEIDKMLSHEKDEVVEIPESYGPTGDESTPIVESLAKRPNDFADFMMRFELGLEKPQPRRALKSGATIGGAYVLGGLIPLAPYILIDDATVALKWSIVITAIALLVFGYVKGTFTGTQPVRSALQTFLIGSVAAAAAYFIARLIGG